MKDLTLEEIEQRKDYLNKLKELQIAELEFTRSQPDTNRARAVSVGTAFGGTSEIVMRGDSGNHLYCYMQPVEVLELIHQLAANIGCHLAIQPREDFASWRNWHVPADERKRLGAHAPFVSDMALFSNKGSSGETPAPELLGSNTYIEASSVNVLTDQEKKHVSVSVEKIGDRDEVMATKKIINKRSTKRASKTA
jgi:hypothetical protein